MFHKYLTITKFQFITSIKMHLAKCSDINKMTGDAIMEGLNNICNTNCS